MKNLINHDVTQTILTIVKPTSRGTIRGYSKGQSVTCTTLPQQSIQAEYFQLPDPDYNGKDLALVWLPKSYGMDYQDLPDTALTRSPLLEDIRSPLRRDSGPQFE